MAKNAFWTPKKALKWVRRVGLTIFCRKGTIYAFLAQSSAAEIAPFPMPPRPILAAKKALFPPFLTPKLSDGRRSRAQKSNGWSGSRTTRSKRATPAFHSGQGLLNTDSPNRSIRSKQKPLPEFPWAARAAGLWWWWWAWASLQDDVGSDGGGGSVTYVCFIRFACRRRGRKKKVGKPGEWRALATKAIRWTFRFPLHRATPCIIHPTQSPRPPRSILSRKPAARVSTRPIPHACMTMPTATHLLPPAIPLPPLLLPPSHPKTSPVPFRSPTKIIHPSPSEGTIYPLLLRRGLLLLLLLGPELGLEVRHCVFCRRRRRRRRRRRCDRGGDSQMRWMKWVRRLLQVVYQYIGIDIPSQNNRLCHKHSSSSRALRRTSHHRLPLHLRRWCCHRCWCRRRGRGRRRGGFSRLRRLGLLHLCCLLLLLGGRRGRGRRRLGLLHRRRLGNGGGGLLILLLLCCLRRRRCRCRCCLLLAGSAPLLPADARPGAARLGLGPATTTGGATDNESII